MKKKDICAENYIFLGLFVGFFSLFAVKMGMMNMVNTIINTAYSLLIDTVLYLTAMMVVMGAISALLSEFGVVSLMNRLLAPLMNPVFNLPGAASISVVTTFLSDNPAILTLADDSYFKRYFKKYQFPALTNLATAFGMGMIVCTYMLSLSTVSGESYGVAVLIGFLGAVVGSIVSTRLMLHYTKKVYGKEAPALKGMDGEAMNCELRTRPVRDGNAATRFLNALLEGGASGVKMGVSIIPGVLVFCSFIMLLTRGPGEAGTYTGAAYEGIALLPALAQKLRFLLNPLFGFSSPEAISVPITALGAAGASLSMVRQLLTAGQIHGNDIAVFTSMCMCWSGYLSTHISMMDCLNCRELTGKAIISHTIGGLCAGVFAHWCCVLAAIAGIM